jgi:hypothetical protein
LPAVAELTVSVEVPEPPLMLDGLRVAVSPADGFAVRVTVPVNPLTGAIVIVTVVEAPALIMTLVGLAVIVKSVNVKVAVVERVRIPSVLVIVTVYMPATEEVHVRVAVPEPVIVAGVIAPQVRPAGTVSLSVWVPAKPLMAAAVIVDVADDPTVVAAGEVAVMVKSANLNVADAV